MALRKRKPTSPGRRFQTVSDFSEITKDTPEKSLLAPEAQHRRPQQLRPQDRPPPGGGHKQRTASSTSSGTRTACRPRSPPSSTTPTATAASCCSTTSTARSATSSPPQDVKVGDLLQTGQGSEIRPGNALPLRYIPVGTTVHNVELQPGGGGKMARSRRHQRAAGGQGGRLRHPAPAQHRDAPRADRLPGHRRRGRQRRGRADQDRQGRPQPLEGRPPADPRRRHEPRRPPPRWRRGQDLRWPPPGVAVGQARGPHPRQDQAVPEAHRPPPPYARQRGGRRHAPQPQEGPVRRRPPAQEGRRPQRAGREEGHQDLVAAAPRSSPTWSATPSPSTTGASTCPCTSPSRWSATSSASSRPPAPSGTTPARRSSARGRR